MVKNLIVDDAISGDVVLLVVVVAQGVMQGLGQIADVVGTKCKMVFSVLPRLCRRLVLPDRGDDCPVKMAFQIQRFIVTVDLIEGSAWGGRPGVGRPQRRDEYAKELSKYIQPSLYRFKTKRNRPVVRDRRVRRYPGKSPWSFRES